MRDENTKQTLQMCKTVAPGTLLREGLENVLRAKTGGLIVVGVNNELMKIVDGGFAIDCECTPSHLYELSKMDGAIILSDDATRILYANTQLLPDNSIVSDETGIRHRTADRVAKQTGRLVISVSQRRNIITLYKGNLHYELSEIGVILTKATQAIRTLERYKSVLAQQLSELGMLEFEDIVTMSEVVQVIQKFDIVLRISDEIESYIIELGSEGRLVKMQLDDLMKNVEDEARRVLRDYQRTNKQELELKDMFSFHKKTSEKGTDDYIDSNRILKLLGYSNYGNMLDENLTPRGYRMLHRIPRLRATVINKLVEHFERLPHIVAASKEELDEVDGVGAGLARTIREGLQRLQEQHLIER
jgi:diadenylate cyclase